MKGVELPINVLVIVAIAVIVLLGLIALFMGVFGPTTGQINMVTIKQTACGEMLSLPNGCGVATTDQIINIDIPFDVNGDSEIGNNNLLGLCVYHYGCDEGVEGISANADELKAETLCCKRICACPQIPA